MNPLAVRVFETAGDLASWLPCSPEILERIAYEVSAAAFLDRAIIFDGRDRTIRAMPRESLLAELAKYDFSSAEYGENMVERLGKPTQGLSSHFLYVDAEGVPALFELSPSSQIHQAIVAGMTGLSSGQA